MEMRNGKNRFMCIMTISPLTASTRSLLTDPFDKVDKLIARFEQAHQAGDVLHLQLDFAALTADVITCDGSGGGRGLLFLRGSWARRRL
jgi:hypothetical protein